MIRGLLLTDNKDITYDEIYESQDNLWNFLFFTGYLKKVSERFDDSNDHRPNRIVPRDVKF